MTMDLWYDLAVRELPVLDDGVLEKLRRGEPEEPAEEEDEAEPDEGTAVDFF